MPGATLLFFLTTSCQPCQGLWEVLGDEATRRALAHLRVSLAIVTPSRSMEDERALERLAPPGVAVHMRSETWFGYGVGQAGTVVLVRNPPGGEPPWERTGEVLGSATPASLDELTAQVRSWLAGSV